LWRHTPGTPQPDLDILARYVEVAQSKDICRIAITEHSHRFVQIDAVAAGFWEGDDPKLAAATQKVWRDEQGADLDTYCDQIRAAQSAGLPVELGIEVDLLPERSYAMAGVLGGYPFDVRVGSVHWLGAWLFDAYDHDVFGAEWDYRGTEQAWDDYARALMDLAASGLCDVVGHCDVVKVAGRIPDAGFRREVEDRLVDTLARSGLVVEVSSAGWRKLAAEQYPSRAILDGLFAAGVEITLGSDAHVPEQVGCDYDRLLALVRDVGYEQVIAFPGGRRTPVAING
jgi:histidinol-phosphatase (PHP family)